MKTNNLIALLAVAFLSTASCFAKPLTLNIDIVADPAASTIVKNIIPNVINIRSSSGTAFDDSHTITQFINTMQGLIIPQILGQTEKYQYGRKPSGIQPTIQKVENVTQNTILVNRQQGINPDLGSTPPTLQALGIQNGDTLKFWIT